MHLLAIETPGLVALAVHAAIIASVLSLITTAAALLARRAPALLRHALLLGALIALIATPAVVLVYHWASDVQAPQLVLPDSSGVVQGHADRSGRLGGSRADAAEQGVSQIAPPQWGIVAGSAIVFVIVWAVGALMRLYALWVSLAPMRAVQASLKPLTDGPVAEDVERLCGVLKLPRRVRVCSSAIAPSPFVCGWVRPAVVLPAKFAESADPKLRRAVLLHELAHIKRGDCRVGAVACFAVILYWWNPLVGLLVRDLSRAREEVCDDFVLANGADGRSLATFLVDTAEQLVTARVPWAVGIAGGPSSPLEQRIKRLLRPRGKLRTRLKPSLALLFGAVPIIPAFALTHADYHYSEVTVVFQQADKTPASTTNGVFLWKAEASAPGAAPAPEVNYGRANRYWVENEVPGHLHRTLLAFPGVFGDASGQIPPGSRIRTATLRLTTDIEDYSGTIGSVAIHRVLVPWQETQVTWSNFNNGGVPGVDFDSQESDSIQSVPDGGEHAVYFDLASAVRQWSRGAPNYGVILLTPSHDGAFFHSEEFPEVSKRPRLTVTFSPVPERRSLALTTVALAMMVAAVFRARLRPRI